MERPLPIPDDLATCQELLRQLQRAHAAVQQQHAALEQERSSLEYQLTEQGRVLDETAAAYEHVRQERDALKHELALYRRWAFGQRRERIVEGEGQRHLFEIDRGPSPPQDPAPEAESAASAGPPTGRGPRHRARKLDLDRLPHRRIEHDVQDEQKACGTCGRRMACIGHEESRVLNYQPAVLEVEVHVRPKYACSCCKEGVLSPPPPPRPISRSMAGAGLISFLLVSKFGDHLPCYRLEDILVRHGLHLPRSTLCDWVKSAAGLLRPLAELMRERVLCSPILWTDDTPVRLLDRAAKGGSRLARFWAYIGDEQHPYTVYDFTSDRRRVGPDAFLSGWSGYLQADAYGGYDGIALDSGGQIVRVACGSHIRRKFFDARDSAPRPSAQMLEWFRQLYEIEDRAREWPAADRLALRQREAVPILAKIKEYLNQLQQTALPKSALGQAASYALNQWDAFGRYASDGRLSIDNNVSERTLRAQAIGRRNWLFLGHEAAGPRAAVIYTIMAGAKRHRLEPWAYLSDVLLHLHASSAPDADDHSLACEESLEAFLPDRWAASHPQHILTHRLEESRDKRARQQARRTKRRH